MFPKYCEAYSDREKETRSFDRKKRIGRMIKTFQQSYQASIIQKPNSSVYKKLKDKKKTTYDLMDECNRNLPEMRRFLGPHFQKDFAKMDCMEKQM